MSKYYFWRVLLAVKYLGQYGNYVRNTKNIFKRERKNADKNGSTAKVKNCFCKFFTFKNLCISLIERSNRDLLVYFTLSYTLRVLKLFFFYRIRRHILNVIKDRSSFQSSPGVPSIYHPLAWNRALHPSFIFFFRATPLPVFLSIIPPPPW